MQGAVKLRFHAACPWLQLGPISIPVYFVPSACEGVRCEMSPGFCGESRRVAVGRQGAWRGICLTAGLGPSYWRHATKGSTNLASTVSIHPSNHPPGPRPPHHGRTLLKLRKGHPLPLVSHMQRESTLKHIPVPYVAPFPSLSTRRAGKKQRK